MSRLRNVYPKKRYKIEYIPSPEDGFSFVMTGPYIDENTEQVKVWKGTKPSALSNKAFDDGADEVAHNYDLSLLDILGNMR